MLKMIDYKKIIKSRSVRLKIMQFLSFIPDKQMLQLQYRIKTGRHLNLDNPKRFTEKLQWYKLYYKNPRMIQCVDKYEVRKYVEEKGLAQILIPCYGVYDSANAIDWNALPNQFVMKDTLGGGGNAVAVVKEKSKANLTELTNKAALWVKINSRRKDAGREWPYYSGKAHRILLEEYLASEESGHGLIDYKFFCFGGKIAFIYIMGNRKVGESVCVTIVDRNFNILPVRRVGDNALENITKPINFDDMCRIAETLAADFPHVRVDLYDQDDTIRFGELTFYNASGYMMFDPDAFDFEMGEKFAISTERKSANRHG